MEAPKHEVMEAPEHEVMAALELDPAHYIDTSMPMATAGFTSLGWQALMAKWQVQAVLESGTLWRP